jgi:quinate/shikimate dehydrogenase (NAD+)
MSQRRMLVGLIGANIMGSLSPALFADAFAAAGIDGLYHLMDAARLPMRSLPAVLEAVKLTGFSGLNVTYPFKQDIIPLLDAIDPEAKEVGAVNTVVIDANLRTTGYNFDRRGWRNAFAEKFGAESARGATAVLVGAGGAGRAVSCALLDLGIGSLIIHDQDAKRAQTLAAELTKVARGSRISVSQDLAHDIASADGVINATQNGMRGFPGNPVPSSALKASHWAADVIYTPIDTEFIKAATAKGCSTMSGDGMCVHQAVEAFRQFTGITPDLARMHEAFAAGLAERERNQS